MAPDSHNMDQLGRAQHLRPLSSNMRQTCIQKRQRITPARHCSAARKSLLLRCRVHFMRRSRLSWLRQYIRAKMTNSRRKMGRLWSCATIRVPPVAQNGTVQALRTSRGRLKSCETLLDFSTALHGDYCVALTYVPNMCARFGRGCSRHDISQHVGSICTSVFHHSEGHFFHDSAQVLVQRPCTVAGPDSTAAHPASGDASECFLMLNQIMWKSIMCNIVPAREPSYIKIQHADTPSGSELCSPA